MSIIDPVPPPKDDSEERKLWSKAGPPRKCPKCGAEMSNQFVTTGEHDNTRRWVCPNCGNQDMRSQLDEPVTIREEVSYHKQTVSAPTPPPTTTDDTSKHKETEGR